MATEGPRFPNSGVDDAGIGTLTWTNPGNVVVDDGTFATVSIGLNETSHYLKATDFGFVNVGGTVDGHTVEWKRGVSGLGGPVRDAAVRIVKGGTIGATDKSAAGVNWPDPVAYRSYGGAADLWGETWQATDVKATTYGAAIAGTNGLGASITAQIDAVRITINFTILGSIQAPLLRIGKWDGRHGGLEESGTIFLGRAIGKRTAPSGWRFAERQITGRLVYVLPSGAEILLWRKPTCSRQIQFEISRESRYDFTNKSRLPTTPLMAAKRQRQTSGPGACTLLHRT